MGKRPLKSFSDMREGPVGLSDDLFPLLLSTLALRHFYGQVFIGFPQFTRASSNPLFEFLPSTLFLMKLHLLSGQIFNKDDDKPFVYYSDRSKRHASPRS